MFVAFTEIRRSLGRFSLLTAAVALLVLLLLFFQAVAGTLTRGLTGGLASSSADVLVYDEQARRNPATSIVAAGVEARVAATPEVAATSPIGLSVFTGTTGTGDVDVQLVGGDPSGPSVPAEVAHGRLPRDRGEALFSGSSFDDRLEVGERVTVEGVVLEVVGTADDAAFNVLPTLYVPYADYVAAAQARAGAPIDVAPSLIGVTLVAGANPEAVAASLTDTIDGIEALERSTAVAALPGVGSISRSFLILYLLLYLVVGIVTGVFFLILTVQKVDALVLLRAVGASNRELITSVLVQALAVVRLGAVVGTAVTATRRSVVAREPAPPSIRSARVREIVMAGTVDENDSHSQLDAQRVDSGSPPDQPSKRSYGGAGRFALCRNCAASCTRSLAAARSPSSASSRARPSSAVATRPGSPTACPAFRTCWYPSAARAVAPSASSHRASPARARVSGSGVPSARNPSRAAVSRRRASAQSPPTVASRPWP